MVFGIYKPPETADDTWASLKIGDINDVVEWDYTRYFCGAGTFSMIIPRTSTYADKITVGCFLIAPNGDNYDGFIVKNIRYENDTLKITGYDLNGMLVDRITVTKTDDGKDAQSGATETIVKHYVAANCVEAEDAERNFPALYIAEDLARGNPNDAAAPRLSRVSDVIADILGAAGMGYRIYPDFSKTTVQLIFEVYEEVNRTDEQTENSRAIFAYGHGNITEMTRETGVTADRNTFYCELSDGLVTRYDKKIEGADNAETVAENPEETTGAETSETTETAAFSGYNRREEFLELNCELSELEVYAEHEIADRYLETDALEIVAGNPLDYGAVYNVGDIVTVYDRRRDVKLNSVISAAEVKRTATEYSVKIFLGESKPKPLDKMNKDTEALADIVKQPKKTPSVLHAMGSLSTVTTKKDDFALVVGITNDNAKRDPTEYNYVTLGTNSGTGIKIENYYKGNLISDIRMGEGDDFEVRGNGGDGYVKTILSASLNSETFTIGAFKFTFNSDGIYIYNTVKKRGIRIDYTN